MANLADLPEGPSIGTERAVFQDCASPVHAGLRQPDSRERGLPGQVQVQLAAVGPIRQALQHLRLASDANADGNPLSDRPDKLGRNTLEGPGFASFDMRVAREFRLNERVTAEFSGDFFNLFNRTNITDLNTVYGTEDPQRARTNSVLGFNTPRDASNPFQFQYGMKLRF